MGSQKTRWITIYLLYDDGFRHTPFFHIHQILRYPRGRCFTAVAPWPRRSSSSRVTGRSSQKLAGDPGDPGIGVILFWIFLEFDLRHQNKTFKTGGKLFLIFGSPFHLCPLYLVQNFIRVWVAMQLCHG